MSRLYSLGSWSFASVAIALAVLVPLAVPENAFADTAMTCMINCPGYCVSQCGVASGPCYDGCRAECPGRCCDQQCNGDPSCLANCCQSLCTGSSDPNCLANCAVKREICIQWSGNPVECNNTHYCGYGIIKSRKCRATLLDVCLCLDF